MTAKHIFLIKENEEVRLLLIKQYHRTIGRTRWNETVRANDSICLQRTFDYLLPTKSLLVVESDGFCLQKNYTKEGTYYHPFLINHSERRAFPTRIYTQLMVGLNRIGYVCWILTQSIRKNGLRKLNLNSFVM